MLTYSAVFSKDEDLRMEGREEGREQMLLSILKSGHSIKFIRETFPDINISDERLKELESEANAEIQKTSKFKPQINTDIIDK